MNCEEERKIVKRGLFLRHAINGVLIGQVCLSCLLLSSRPKSPHGHLVYPSIAARLNYAANRSSLTSCSNKPLSFYRVFDDSVNYCAYYHQLVKVTPIIVSGDILCLIGTFLLLSLSIEQPTPNQEPDANAPARPQNKRLQQTQAQVNEVVDIMRVNMEKVIERDAKLSQLDDRADALQAGASQFEASAGKLKNKYWWKNMKMNLIIGAVVLIIIIAIGWSIFGGKKSAPPPAEPVAQQQQSRQPIMVESSAEPKQLMHAPAASGKHVAAAAVARKRRSALQDGVTNVNQRELVRGKRNGGS